MPRADAGGFRVARTVTGWILKDRRNPSPELESGSTASRIFSKFDIECNVERFASGAFWPSADNPISSCSINVGLCTVYSSGLGGKWKFKLNQPSVALPPTMPSPRVASSGNSSLIATFSSCLRYSLLTLL